MVEETTPLHIKQKAIKRKALHGITNMNNLRVTNKELRAEGLPSLTKTQFMKILKGVHSEYDRKVKQAQKALRETELPKHITDELDAKLNAKKGDA